MPSYKSKYHQTGKSNLLMDMMLKAKKPGKRRAVRSRKTYYESRKNRSDMPGRRI